METLVILAAVAATLLACVFVATLSKGPRRPPLRLPREEEWADNADAVSKAMTPPQASPIDRGAQVLDARVIGDPAGGGPVIEGEIVDARGGEPRTAPEPAPRTFDVEELDSRMLDQLLDQQSRELKQAQREQAPPRDGPPPSGSTDGTTR